VGGKDGPIIIVVAAVKEDEEGAKEDDVSATPGTIVVVAVLSQNMGVLVLRPNMDKLACPMGSRIGDGGRFKGGFGLSQ
jgi:hypothetical protein